MRPLVHQKKCDYLLQQTGFQNIEVKTEQLGAYLSLSAQKLSWDGRFWFHPQGNPLLDLSQQQTEQLQAVYTIEITQLATDKGVWYDITIFFVVAQK